MLCFCFIGEEEPSHNDASKVPLEYRLLLAPLSPHSPHGIKSSRILWLPPFKGGREEDGG